MYKIVLFNSGKRIKILDTFNIYGEALNKYSKYLKENKVFFPKKYMWDGVLTNYELALTGPINTKKINFFRNEFGALVEIKPKGDFVIKKLSEYEIEEIFIHKNTNKKMTFKDLVKYLLSTDSTKIVTTLNNKLAIEYYDSDHLDLFTLKNNSDSIRLNDLIKDFVYANGSGNFMFFNDPSLENKQLLYDKLSVYLNLDRWYLIRNSTR
jgi:hypothetical protein